MIENKRLSTGSEEESTSGYYPDPDGFASDDEPQSCREPPEGWSQFEGWLNDSDEDEPARC